MKDSVFVINDGLEMRTSGQGKQRFVIRRVTEPIVINTDPEFLAMKPAVAFAEYLRRQIQSVAASPAANTLRARRTELAAFIRGKPWAMERFSGGRMGSTPPMRSEQALNNSGRLAKGIAANKGKDGWRVNVPANRLDERTIHSFERVWNRLTELVPAIGRPLESGIVQEGIRWSMQNMISVQKSQTGKLGMAAIGQAFKVFENVAKLFAAA
jgi:hypothetical protein